MYGSVEGVAALSKMWTNNGAFYDGDDDPYTAEPAEPTDPTASQVAIWLEEVSASLNTALANEGFVTPVTVEEVVLSFDGKVNGIVKDLVDYSHGAGRYFTDKYLGNGISPQNVIDNELEKYIQRRATGLTNQGVPKITGKQGRHVATINML